VLKLYSAPSFSQFLLATFQELGRLLPTFAPRLTLLPPTRPCRHYKEQTLYFLARLAEFTSILPQKQQRLSRCEAMRKESVGASRSGISPGLCLLVVANLNQWEYRTLWYQDESLRTSELAQGCL
jgi:hypothetical protein